METVSFLHYAFVQKAFLAGALIGGLCALLGLFLVLRRLSLIADGLSHVSFGAIALGLALGFYPLAVAIPVVLLGSYLILKLTEKARVYGDAAIGIVSAVGIAGGVILASVSQGFNVDLLSYLFGNILAISNPELVLSVILSLLVFTLIGFYYHDLFATTFDEEGARVAGIQTQRVNAILLSLTAVTVVLAVRVVGIMLVSALLILPAVTALQVARGFRSALVISVLSSVLSVFSGITLAFFLDLPAGATIVLLNFSLFVLALLYRKVRMISWSGR